MRCVGSQYGWPDPDSSGALQRAQSLLFTPLDCAEKVGHLLPAVQADHDNYRSVRVNPFATVVMHLRLSAIIAFLPLLAAGLGCKCPCADCGVPRTPCAPCAFDLCDCREAPPDIAAGFPTVAELILLPAPTETFHLLDPTTCQCFAATNSPLANMVELERHWAKVIMQCDTKGVRKNFCLDRDLLSLHACSIRNESAAAALGAFYQLAGLEAQNHYLQLALEEAEETLSRIDSLADTGVELPPDLNRTAALKRLNELEDQLVQMEFARLQLNGQLQKLLNCPSSEHDFFWPQVDWQPDLEPRDADLELSVGLHTRHDLRGLELLICNLEKITLPVARPVLRFADSTIGSVEPREGLIHVLRCCKCNEHEVPVRCRQLSIFYDDTEGKATGEIKNAVYKIGLQQHRVVIAQQTVLDLRKRHEKLQKTRNVKDVEVFQVSAARSELLQAESQLIEQVVQLKLAKVELKKVQGLLSGECGFQPKLCLEGCCNGACMRCERK